jgi:uncharacterized RDD family membrane protein YckC
MPKPFPGPEDNPHKEVEPPAYAKMDESLKPSRLSARSEPDGSQLTNWGKPNASAEPTPAPTASRVSPNIRMVALGIDFIICYFLAVLTTLTPFLNRIIDFQTVLILFFLTRDYFFQGRGFGKNLMGLKVIDAASGNPPSLTQSALRNIILVAPFVALQVTGTILKFGPLAWLNSAVTELVNVICTIYVAIVLPLESYRALTRPDGLRKGDELASTTIVEGQMDFSHPL